MLAIRLPADVDVGAHGVIAHIEDDTIRILVVRIGHRREVYRD